MTNLATQTPDTKKIQDLVDASFASRFTDLAAMLGYSTSAVALVEAVQDEIPAALAVRVWTQHGNALRLLGRYGEAESLLDRAAALPVDDLPSSTHLLEVRSSLDRNLGKYENAEKSLAAALAAHESNTDPLGLARTYNLLGLVYSESGDRGQALRAFQTAFSFLGERAPLDLLATTGHNLFHTFVADGRLEAAETALASLEPFYSQLTSPRLAAKAAWMRARLFRRLGRRLAARREYARACELLRTAQPSPEQAQLAREMAGV